jgi:hypothetical protein
MYPAIWVASHCGRPALSTPHGSLFDQAHALPDAGSLCRMAHWTAFAFRLHNYGTPQDDSVQYGSNQI